MHSHGGFHGHGDAFHGTHGHMDFGVGHHGVGGIGMHGHSASMMDPHRSLFGNSIFGAHHHHSNPTAEYNGHRSSFTDNIVGAHHHTSAFDYNQHRSSSAAAGLADWFGMNHSHQPGSIVVTANAAPGVYRPSKAIKIACIVSLLVAFLGQLILVAVEPVIGLAVMIIGLFGYTASSVRLLVNTEPASRTQWVVAFAAGVVPQLGWLMMAFRILSFSSVVGLVEALITSALFVMVAAGISLVLSIIAAIIVPVLPNSPSSTAWAHKLIILSGWVMCISSSSLLIPELELSIAAFAVGAVLACGGAASVLYRETRQATTLPTASTCNMY